MSVSISLPRCISSAPQLFLLEGPRPGLGRARVEAVFLLYFFVFPVPSSRNRALTRKGALGRLSRAVDLSADTASVMITTGWRRPCVPPPSVSHSGRGDPPGERPPCFCQDASASCPGGLRLGPGLRLSQALGGHSPEASEAPALTAIREPPARATRGSLLASRFSQVQSQGMLETAPVCRRPLEEGTLLATMFPIRGGRNSKSPNHWNTKSSPYSKLSWKPVGGV